MENNDYECDVCGAPATVAYQQPSVRYILVNGDFEVDKEFQFQSISDDVSALFCEEHDNPDYD